MSGANYQTRMMVMRDIIAGTLDSRGLDIETDIFAGSTMLAVAAERGHMHIVSKLLKEGANASAKNDRHVSALHSACFGGNVEIVKMLCDYGARIDVVDFDGMSAIHYAAMSECGHDAIAFLVNRGADIDQKNMAGETPLHCACAHGRLLNVKRLAQLGCKVDVVSEAGDSPIMTSLKHRKLDIIEFLCGHGADIACLEGCLDREDIGRIYTETIARRLKLHDNSSGHEGLGL